MEVLHRTVEINQRVEKVTKNSLAKGWKLSDIEYFAWNNGNIWSALLEFSDVKVPIGITAVLEVKQEVIETDWT